MDPGPRPKDSRTTLPVSEHYFGGASRFNGTVNWVELAMGDDDHDRLIGREDRMCVAAAIT
jgi:hypothetical protein